MWRNWAENQSMSPVAVEHPSSVDEVVQVVKAAAAAGRRVKAIGSGHSFTSIGLTDGVLVQLDRLDRLMSVDRGTGRVVVQGGMVLRRLNALLAEHGLGLTNMGDVDAQTVAGALATGTHGTGRESAALATQVVRVAPADDVALSTASGRDTAYVAAHVFRGTDHRAYFGAVEALMGEVGGRPHWGKLHGLGAGELRERYPRFEAFVAVRDRLDPERRFANTYLDRVLGA